MTIRFKKVRDFERLQMMQEFEQDLIKEDIDDIYEVEQEIDFEPDDVFEHGIMTGYMNA